MNHSFIKEPSQIEENYQVNDLLDFTSTINDFKESINNINKNSVVALIGPYGSGKSTMLYQIYKDQINDNSSAEKWFIFDAWQYPERKDLWEFFILDIARQCNKKLFKNTKNKIDGKKGKGVKVISNTLISVASVITSSVISTVSFLAICALSLTKSIIHPFQTSPIKRLYEFQDLLLDNLNKIDKDIFIIIEDIDRSGDMGVYFLETLKQFIKNREQDINNKVVVIVPIGEQIWDKDGDKKVKDSYSKILDLNITFSQKNIDFTNFINKVFYVNRLTSSSTSQDIVISHLRYLFEDMILKEQQGTIRDIKSILRKTESNFFKLQEEHQKQIDIRLLILFTAIEYFHRSESEDSCMFYVKNIIKDDQYSKKYKEYKYLRGEFWGSKLFLMIIEQEDNIDSIKDISFLIQIGDCADNSLKISKEGAFLMQDRKLSPSIYAISEVYFNLTQVTVNDITQN